MTKTGRVSLAPPGEGSSARDGLVHLELLGWGQVEQCQRRARDECRVLSSVPDPGDLVQTARASEAAERSANPHVTPGDPWGPDAPRPREKTHTLVGDHRATNVATLFIRSKDVLTSSMTKFVQSPQFKNEYHCNL